MKNIALQLYSVIADFNRDPYQTLKRVAAIGYRYVEFAGYGGKDAKTLAAWLSEFAFRLPARICSFQIWKRKLKF